MIEFRQAPPRAPFARAHDAAPPPDRYILRGDIVPMAPGSEALRGGRVCVEGNSIAAVLAPGDALPPAFAQAAEIDTRGTIYPGLIDLHNHLT
ncbi:hypothetical protein [Paracidovorax anthurii]|uniref:Amidohydrolase family protein n=1 Tax=Paracidovorax anthurii TaxID=78229 RepID=A0A328YE60_9BURK|nr:hypothetical protein [Paracidovorax anthurii]RAR71413.1 hypothetical protein AX018_11009 [Paracidovorax anthurii]